MRSRGAIGFWFGIASLIWAPGPLEAGRQLSSIQTELSKNLNSAYSSFYHRHDTAGCFHIAKAKEGLKSGALSPGDLSSIDEALEKARQFCIDDKVSRHDILQQLRIAIKLTNTRTVLTAE